MVLQDPPTRPGSVPNHSKLQRWTDMIAALLARPFGTTFAQLANDVPAYADGTDPAHKESVKRGFERDKDELREFGIPIQTVDADDENETRYRLRPTAFYLPFLALPDDDPGHRGDRGHRVPPEGYRSLPTVTLTPEDLDLLAAAAGRLAHLGDATLAADARSAASKLAFDLPLFGATAPDVHLLDGDVGADAKVFERLGEALRGRKLVTFTYLKPGGDATRRTVQPWGLVFLNAHWYLVARDGDATKNFRVSRMRGVRMNTSSRRTRDFETPPEFSLREHARSREAWELGDAPPALAEVRFTGTSGAAAAAARAGEPVAGDATLRRYPVRRLETFARWLLSLAGDAHPVSPPELVALFQAQLRHTLQVHGERP